MVSGHGFDPPAERLPSADRSQQILNTAGRHRDSAARLCSAFLFWLITQHLIHAFSHRTR
jgi:hypothetical protein